MPEIHELETVGLRHLWPNEAQDFTPWLAANLHLLRPELKLELEFVAMEDRLPVGGRVDIIAKQVPTMAKVVIENQLEESDDSHCLRLLGYAAYADAHILVWVARDFTDYHKKILSWLNESDNIDVYAVAVRAYRVGDALAADFRLIVGPSQSQPGTTSVSPAITMGTYYANFYRPVVDQLRHSGLFPVSVGGYRGRWRSFQTEYPKVVYAAELSEVKAWAFLDMYGADNRRIYDSLTQHRAEIDAKLKGDAVWGRYWVGLQKEIATTDPMLDQPAVRQWIAKKLLELRDVVGPYLKQVMEPAPTSGEGGDEDGTDTG